MTLNRRGRIRRDQERFGAPPERLQRVRLGLVLGCAMVALALIGIRLCFVHLNPRNELSREERVHIGKANLYKPRGRILDRNETLPLATDKKVPSLYVVPEVVLAEDSGLDPAALANQLHDTLGLEVDAAMDAMTRRTAQGRPMKFVWLKRWIRDPEERNALPAIIEAGAGAFGERKESIRFYPQGDSAAHLLGFVNRDGQASEGVEKTMDAYLASVPGSVRARKASNKDGRFLLPSLTLERVQPEGGHDVVLTIDMAIQHSLERALDERMAACKAPRGMGIVMDPYTGAILAMATRPAFDPNRYDEFDGSLRANRAVLDIFEPGSAFKIVTASAALEHQLITQETQIDLLNGRFNPYGHTISDDHRNPGLHPFSECFAVSSNIAIIKVAALLGEERMEAWIRRFGFGSTTSRDFITESAGLFRPRSKWSRLSMGSLPMGQEIGVTMPQLARAYAVIANGGYLVEPYFIEKVVDAAGQVLYRHQPLPPNRILSGRTAATMRELCRLVVAEGTGKPASIPEYRVGGKTGTAQVARKDGRGYDPHLWTPVFAGFAPVSKPRLVAVIVVPEPAIRLHYGGYVCGPVFRDVVREALIRLGVPEEPVEDAGDSGAGGIKLADRSGGAIEGTPFLDLESLDSLELVARDSDESREETGMPDFRGMTKRQVRDALRELGVPWDPRGAGWAVSQDPPPGTPISEVKRCGIVFASKAVEEMHATENAVETAG